jgi:hypothetical protein
MSVIVREDSDWPTDHKVLSNPEFQQEKRNVAQLARLYGAPLKK